MIENKKIRNELKAFQERLEKPVINKHALEKIIAYSLILREITNTDYECMGLLTRNEEDPANYIRDAFLIPSQVVSQSHCDVRDEGLSFMRKARDLAQKYKIVGWWHSHGSFQPFHSSTDDSYFEIISPPISLSNYLKEGLDINLGSHADIDFTKKDDEVRLSIITESGLGYDLKFNVRDIEDKDARQVLNNMPTTRLVLKTKAVQSLNKAGGSAYSLVINNYADKPFVKAHIYTSKGKFLNTKLLVDEDEDQALDMAQLIAEVIRDVKPLGRDLKYQDFNIKALEGRIYHLSKTITQCLEKYKSKNKSLLKNLKQSQSKKKSRLLEQKLRSASKQKTGVDISEVLINDSKGVLMLLLQCLQDTYSDITLEFLNAKVFVNNNEELARVI